MTAITVTDLRKRYGEVQALDGVTFDVREGEVFGLLGPNGAGEPTTGLDPEARAAMWVEVQRLAAQESLTILLTTHYLEEADQLSDRLAIVSRGQVVVEGTADELKRGLQGELVTVELQDSNGSAADAVAVVDRFPGARETSLDGRHVNTRVPNGAQAIPAILGLLDDANVTVASVTTSRPSLDDVYLHYTGREFAANDAGDDPLRPTA